MNHEDPHRSRARHPPHRIRLPGFVTGEEIGLGDVIKRATHAIGIKTCNSCAGRADALNRWLVFTRRVK
jgi:hypothetical protein